MRRFIRYRQPKSTESAEAIEVWPVFVDVLAAALVFLLLAFFAILSRDVLAAKERGDRDGRVAACNRTRAKIELDHREKLAQRDATVQRLMNETTTTCAETLEAQIPKYSDGCGDACQQHLRAARLPPKVLAETSGWIVDGPEGQQRGIVQFKYAFAGNSEISFVRGCAEPTYRVEGLEMALALLVNEAARQSCTPNGRLGGDDWCVIGFEVAGHADQVPLGDGSGLCGANDAKSKDNWELSTNRASHVITRILAKEFRSAEKVNPDPGFEIRAAGYESRVPMNNLCGNSYGDQDNRECLDENRRVEFRFRLKTPILPQKPEKPVLVDCDGLK